MTDNTTIKTTKLIYPQIYAYNHPQTPSDTGWIKIGYTERKNVDERIKEQNETAAGKWPYQKLWSAPAKFSGKDQWFKDKQLHAYLTKFKNVPQREHTEWFYYNGTPEKAYQDYNDFVGGQVSQSKEQLSYVLRDEQEAAVQKTYDYAISHENGEFLWNAKPRFGKTLTTYDLARKLDANNVLVVTNRPAIANSWFDDFEKFIAWQTTYKFVSTSDSLKDHPVLTREQYVQTMDDDSKMIGFISLQDLKGAISFGGSHNKLKWVKDLNWDILVIDESHEGRDTFKTDVAFENITRKFTLNLSGTPFKAVASGKFSEDQIYNWTYEDEQNAKTEWSDVQENNPYEKLPKLNLFSYQMSQMITDEVNKGAQIDGENIDYAFDLNEFFETNDSGKFLHEADIKRWLDSLAHNEKYPFSTKELRDELKHTFWLLNRVASAKALQKLLEKHPVFENYKIILAAGDGKANEDDELESDKSLDRVRKAIKDNDKTITLSVGQLTTGVTVPEWTAVLMLSNMKSPSLYMQAAFRAQNPWEYDVNGEMRQKDNAYVFDFAPERTLIIYDEFANNLSGKTSNGGGTTEDRKNNIRKLLNFFPVIAEDNEGKMVELDVNQVLTIPKAIKAQEVVKRGFMSNLLFQNISGIFASAGAREILEQLNPVEQGKVTPTKPKEREINTQDVKVDENGQATVDNQIVVATTQTHFGPKVYETIEEAVQTVAEEPTNNLTNLVANVFKQNTQEAVKDIAKEVGVTAKQAQQVVDQSANVIAREVEMVQKQAEIKQEEAKVEYETQLVEAKQDTDGTWF
jgi:superfamily II DNA or RNA helicase